MVGLGFPAVHAGLWAAGADAAKGMALAEWYCSQRHGGGDFNPDDGPHDGIDSSDAKDIFAFIEVLPAPKGHSDITPIKSK